MALAIEMFFDERADAAVRRLWRRITDSGLPSLETYSHGRHRPHVSLTVASRWDPDSRPDLLADLETMVNAQHRLKLDFQALGIFAGTGGVLFLAAVATLPLLALHDQVCALLLDHDIAQWPEYLPGTWVPHCTLATDISPANIPAAVAALASFEPFRARVAGIGLTDSSTGHVRPVS